MRIVLCIVLATVVPTLVFGHGRLWDPPSRSTMWRRGYRTPHNYNDNQLFCGGFAVQWVRNGGKCGICGDPYDGARQNEAGGKYAKGIITRTYKEGQIIDIDVQVTANHKGWFEFRICPNNDVSKRATQECLDKHLLEFTNGEGTRHFITSLVGHHKMQVRLPQGVTCTQCVLQWKWNVGHSWGHDSKTGKGCIGCGPQEQFYGCADIAIEGSGSGSQSTLTIQSTTSTPKPTTTQKPTTTTTTTTKPTPKPRTATTKSPTTSTTTTTTTTPKPTTTTTTTAATTTKNQQMTTTAVKPSNNPHIKVLVCNGAGAYKHTSGMSAWCNVNCRRGFCPATHCNCRLL